MSSTQQSFKKLKKPEKDVLDHLDASADGRQGSSGDEIGSARELNDDSEREKRGETEASNRID